MSKVKLNIRNLAPTELIAKARQIAIALTNNPTFPNSQAIVALITGAADELEAAYTDAQTTRQLAVTKTSIQHDKTDLLVGILRQAAAYIESVAGDDESKLLSAGVGIKTTTPAASSGDTPAPINLHATAGDHEGEIDLAWDRVQGAKSYVLERSPDSPTLWAQEAIVTRSSATVSGLSSGTHYWFRVSAVSSAGQSGWSDPAVRMAP